MAVHAIRCWNGTACGEKQGKVSIRRHLAKFSAQHYRLTLSFRRRDLREDGHERPDEIQESETASAHDGQSEVTKTRGGFLVPEKRRLLAVLCTPASCKVTTLVSPMCVFVWCEQSEDRSREQIAE